MSIELESLNIKLREIRSLRILVVEDDEDESAMLASALLKASLFNKVFCVPNGAACLQYLLREGIYADYEAFPVPDIILLDLNMPVMGGLETLQKIREHAELRDIPVIVLSGSESGEDITASYAAGAASYLVKPRLYEGLIEMAAQLNRYWSETVRLASHEASLIRL